MGAKTTDWATVEVPEPIESAPEPEVAEVEEQASEARDGEATDEEPAADAETAAEEEQNSEEPPETEPADTEPTDTEPTDTESADTEPADEDSGAAKEEEPGSEAGLAAEQEPATSPAAGPAPRRFRMAAWQVAGLVVILAMLGGSAYWFANSSFGSGSDAADSADAVVAVDPATKARAIIKALDLTNLTLADEPNVGLVVSGMVETYEQQDALNAELHQAEIVIFDRTRVVEQILEAVAITLSAISWPEPNFDEHLVITHEGGGRIAIDGFLGPQVDRSSLHRRLESDVPGMTNLRFTRPDLRTWQAILAQRIEDAGLSDWLTVSPAGAEIRVEGELTAAQARTWRAVGEAFVEESRGYPKISIGVTALPDPEPSVVTETVPEPLPTEEVSQTTVIPRPQISVIGIIIPDDGDAIALLSNGSTVKKGDRFDSGAVVREVALDRVIISGGAKDYVYRVKEKR